MSRFDALGSAYLAEPLMRYMGERVVVHESGKPSRTVFAEVRRELPSLIDSRTSGTATPRAALVMRDHPASGVCSRTMDRNATEIEFAIERPGGATSRRKVLDFENATSGMLTLFVS